MEIGKIHLLNINDIRVDGGTQSRAALDQATVDEYAQAMQEGAEFPVLLAYWDGVDVWLAEGFHRHAAARKAGIQGLQTKVFGGDRRAALSHSLTANVKHGLRRTNADKRHCVTLMLRDEEWVKWSDGQIAQHCSVDPKTVSNIRKELILTMEIPESDMRKGADGRTYDTSAIGKKKTGVEPKKPDEHGCLTCGEIFDKEVWHCPTCNTHWPPSKDTCPNCYKAPTVTTTKLSAAAVADQVFGEGDEPPVEAEAIQKPAHGVPQEDLSEAFNWQAVADQYLAENLALKKDLEEAKKIIHQLEDETALVHGYFREQSDQLVSIRKENKDLAWERDQFFSENNTLKAQNQHLTKEAEQRKLSWDKLKKDLLHAEEDIEQLTKSRDSFYGKIQELRAAMDPLYKELNRLREEAAEAVQLAADKAHWFGVAEQLREELDEAKATITRLEEEEIGSLLVTKANLSAKVEMLEEDLRAANARIETLGTLVDEYCAQAKAEMDEKFRFQMMIVTGLAGAPKPVTEDVLKGATPLRDAMFKLQEMLAPASDSNDEAEKLREQLNIVTTKWHKTSAEFEPLLMEKAELEGELSRTRRALKSEISAQETISARLRTDLSQLQLEKFNLVAKVTELETQIASFTSGTADATRAGAHAPARAHSLSSPTIDITHVGDPECVGKEVKGSGEKGKRKRTQKSDPRSSHPAIQAVLNQLGQYPPIELYDRIIEILGDNPDKTKLRQCREEWLTRGYSKANFAWLTEWYVMGIPVRQGNSATNGQPVKSRQLLEWEAKMAMIGMPVSQ